MKSKTVNEDEILGENEGTTCFPFFNKVFLLQLRKIQQIILLCMSITVEEKEGDMFWGHDIFFP